MELPKAPMLRSFAMPTVRLSPAAGIALIVAALFLSGCQSTPVTPVRTSLAVTPAAQQEALFPTTLKLNDDLFKTVKPSNNRAWTPEQAKLAEAEFLGHKVRVHNIRDCRWRTFKDFKLGYYDKTFDLSKLRTVDFIVVPFNETPSLGHTMLSFGFEGDEYLAVSVEIRKELGEAFNPIAGFFNQYELIYVVASEQDVVQRRVLCDLSDVYVYRSTATPDQARALFTDVMRRVDKLSKQPEFYDTLTNNCTTNIRNHVNHLKPDEIPYDYRVLLPGLSDKLAYDLGLIERHGSYAETRLHARVNYLAYLHRDDPGFSRAIRQ
jgi:hypothetical protein